MSQPPSNQIPSNLSKNNHQVNVNYPIHNNNNNYNNNNNIEKKDPNNQILQKRKIEDEKVPLQNKRQKTNENSEINQEIKEQDENINENNNNNDNNENNNLNNLNLDKSSLIFIVCDPDKNPHAKITFSEISVKDHLERHKTNRLTDDHLDQISKEAENNENDFIFNLFDGLKSGQNLYGSLHHLNQILIISKEQFTSLMKKKQKPASDESQKRKIKDCLSKVSKKFHFKKVDEKSSDTYSVIEYLKEIYKQNDNNDNNNNNNNQKSNDNNNNNDNKNKLHAEQPHSPQTNEIDENDLNFIENDNNNKDNDNFDYRNNNNSNDPMKIDNYSVKRSPPKFSPDPNLPFDPFDLLSIGRNGEGFDDEILGYICSPEQIDSESLDSFINSF